MNILTFMFSSRYDQAALAVMVIGLAINILGDAMGTKRRSRSSTPVDQAE